MLSLWSWRGLANATLWILLLSVMVSCHKKYHFIAENMNREDARTYCRAKYKDLARADNAQEMSRLAAAGGGYQGDAWIGRHNFDPWVWALIVYASNLDGTYRNWGQGQPNSSSISVCVAMLEGDGLWYDMSCYEELPFVCYNDSAPNAGYTTISADKLVYVNQSMSMFNALDHCKANYRSLAFARSLDENVAIRSKLPSGSMAYIGIFGEQWLKWADDSESYFTDWAAGQPVVGAGDCAASAVHLNGKWLNKPCETLLPFICYSEKTYNFAIRVKFRKSTADLNDPVLTQDLLAKIKAKLRQTLDDFHISWVNQSDTSIFDTGTP